MKINYEAIIFDLGGVVLNIDYQKTIDAFKQIGFKNFENAYTQLKQNQLFDKLETGQITEQDFYTGIQALSASPIAKADIKQAWNAMLLDLPEHRIDWLKRVKQTVPIFLLSNTNSIHLSAFQKIIERSYQDAELLETVFNKTYYSHMIGERKPNRAAFEIILSEHHLSAQKTLFIDDSIQHIEGAKRVGLQTYHLQNGDVTNIF